MKVPRPAELAAAFADRRAFVTGHTGFKGSWLTLWLSKLGARVSGFALCPDTSPSLFVSAGVERMCRHRVADVRSLSALREALRDAEPEVVFHLAAQPLVRRSYAEPVATIEANVLGTAHLLEAIRLEGIRCAVVVITSDKCYKNREWVYAYREEDQLGGHDVYSMSKAAAELVTASYRSSFFPPEMVGSHGVALATARAGNVIGGGDWAPDRIVPDALAALAEGRPISVRRPDSVRPWQHVLEPLGGYLVLAARLLTAPAGGVAQLCEAWNFGPSLEAAVPVSSLVESLIRHWGAGTWEDRRDPAALHEAGLLRLSIEKSATVLGWNPRWSLENAVERTVEWHRGFLGGARGGELRALCFKQIDEYETEEF